jgi:hypothetical protein
MFWIFMGKWKQSFYFSLGTIQYLVGKEFL